MEKKEKDSKWVPIPGYGNKYFINSNGEILSKKNSNEENLLFSHKRKTSKYHVICLTKDKKQRVYYVHRLVAQTFVPNPKKKEVVVHLDGDLSNNHASNLKWMTRSEKLVYEENYWTKNKFENSEDIPKGNRVMNNPERVITKSVLVKDSKDKLFSASDTCLYFKYKGSFHKMLDHGRAMIIRVKNEEGVWKTITVAKIILEDILNKPMPSKSYMVGYKDSNYRNLSPSNLFWDTMKEKRARFKEKYPWKIEMIRQTGLNNSKSYLITERRKKAIDLLAKNGKSAFAAARITGIPYSTLRKYYLENFPDLTEVIDDPKNSKEISPN